MHNFFVAALLRPPEAKFEKSDLEIRLSKAQSMFCQEILGLKFILGAKKIFEKCRFSTKNFKNFFLPLK